MSKTNNITANYDTLRVNMIHNLLDKIENKLNLMAHEIPELKDKLLAYQDGKIKPLYFYNYLTKYWDEINV
jgi:hypothetical protein